MKDILKGLWKWILWIVIILLLGFAIVLFRIHVIDKDYKAGRKSDSSDLSKSSSFSDSSVTDTTSSSSSDNGSGSSSSSTGSVNSSKKGSLGQKIVNGARYIGNSTVKGYEGDSEYNYNVRNFDERFLMYEGSQTDEGIKDILELLITNSNDNFYARTTVTASGFDDNKSISYNGDVQEYQNGIREMENSLQGGEYDVSFKYAGIMTYVNEIVITKK